MTDRPADVAARERVQAVEAALAALDELGTSQRECALDAIQALLELYGDAFARVLAMLERPGAAPTPSTLAEDELVGHLLMVHALHPHGFEEPEQVPGAPGGPPLVQISGTRNGGPR